MSKKLEFKCNKCKEEFSIEDGVAFDDIKCPKCGEKDDLLVSL
ncbi:MAG: hypothetical protein ACTSRW_04210 [Candidatus Helarchaeota archaeon]